MFFSVYNSPFTYDFFSRYYFSKEYEDNLNLLLPSDFLNYEIVELLCGTCFYTKKKFFNAKKYTGYDINKKIINYLNKKYSLEGKKSFEVINLNEEFPKLISDYHILLNGLYHFKKNNDFSTLDLINHMIENSRKGVFIVEGIKNKFNKNSFFLKYLLAKFKDPGTGPQYYYFNKNEIKNLLDQNFNNHEVFFDKNFAYIKILK